MQTVKNNPAPTPTGAKVEPDDALRRVIQLGKAVHTAALDFCWSAAFFLLLVNYYKDPKAKGYMSKSDAIDYLEKQLREQTGVKNRMLANYVSTASQLMNGLVNNPKMFAPYLARIAGAENAEAGSAMIADWYQKEKGRKIDSMRQLMEALGESKPKQVRATPVTAAKAAERIGNAIAAIETKAADKGKAAVQAADRAVVQAVVEKVQSKLALVVEAIKRLTVEAELDAIIAAAQKQKKELHELSKRATAEAKAKSKDGGAKASHANGKSKGTARHTQA